METDQAEVIREWLRKVMRARYGGQLAPWARDAGVPEGSPRNFLAGRSRTITALTLQRLADAAGEAAPVVGGQAAPAVGRAAPERFDELAQRLDQLTDAVNKITRAVRARRGK